MLADPVPDGAVRQAGVGLLVASGEVSRQGPHLTLKKSDGRTKHLKRAFSTLTAIFSAKNGSKMTKLTFLQHAVPEFSEKCFGSKKNKAPRP